MKDLMGVTGGMVPCVLAICHAEPGECPLRVHSRYGLCHAEPGECPLRVHSRYGLCHAETRVAACR